MSGFRPQDLEVYRPYRDDVPWELLAASAAAESAIAAAMDLDLLRVARYAGQVAGVYHLAPQTEVRYRLVSLVVAPGFRRRGVGGWLLGHVIGLAETKGAREIVAAMPPGAGGRRFLERYGFAAGDGAIRLELTPE
jgi:GNAT superfamily N-acetyltransferase